MINVKNIDALIQLYPTIVRTVGTTAYDADGNEVAYDMSAVTAQAEADAQAKAEAKTVALAKLAALGLTTADLTALGL